MRVLLIAEEKSQSGQLLLDGWYRRFPNGSTRVLSPRLSTGAGGNGNGNGAEPRNPGILASAFASLASAGCLARPFSRLQLGAQALAVATRSAAHVAAGGRALETGSLAATVWQAVGIPYVLHVFGEDLTEARQRPAAARDLQRLLRNAGAVTVPSRHVRDLLLGYGADEKRIAVVPPGIEIERFAGPLDPTPARERFQLDGQRVLLTVGPLIRRKRHEAVLCALPRLIRSHPNLLYLVAGEGPGQADLLAVARAVGVEEYVRFLGSVDPEQLPALYAASDVVLQPGQTLPTGEVEDFDTAILAASAAGRPVIAARGGAGADAICDGASGVLIDPDCPHEIASAVERLLGDSGEARRIGANGRAWAAEFSWERCAALAWEVLARVSASARRAAGVS